MSEPQVSIIIPCRNAARWLRPCLESALGQIEVVPEVILVDDGSTDGSQEIARTVGSGRIKLIQQENQGASAARNRGAAESRGRFLQFLDADDLLARDKLREHLRVASRNEDHLSFGSVVHFEDGRDVRSGTLARARLPHPAGEPVSFLIDLLGGNGAGWMVQTGQWLVPRRLYDVAGPWNEELSVDDDGEFFSRVVLSATRIETAADARCFYRHHRDGSNLSAQSARTRRGAKSLLTSTRLKAKHLESRTKDARMEIALAASYNALALASYPRAPEISREALQELSRLGKSLNFNGCTRGFHLLRRIAGWRLARRVQTLRQTFRGR